MNFLMATWGVQLRQSKQKCPRHPTYFLWRAIARVQNCLCGPVVGATPQVARGTQVNQLEAAVALAQNDICRLDVSVHHASRVDVLHSKGRGF